MRCPSGWPISRRCSEASSAKTGAATLQLERSLTMWIAARTQSLIQLTPLEMSYGSNFIGLYRARSWRRSQELN